MPITPTYPGIYVEEIPNTSHTITASETSVTVFVGYTHPLKTLASSYGAAVEIFTFRDYERFCGGHFSIGWLRDDVGQAVAQFFANGGSHAWVVPLQAAFHPLPTGSSVVIAAPAVTVPAPSGPEGIAFAGLEPVDGAHPMTVTISNPRPSSGGSVREVADIVVSYGTRTESYRNVSLNATKPTLELQLAASSLVTVAKSGSAYPTEWAPDRVKQYPLVQPGVPSGPFTTYAAHDFAVAFDDDKALDKIPAFNLLLTPGVADFPVVSAGLEVCTRKRAFMIMDPPPEAVADGTNWPLPTIGDLMDGATGSTTIPKSENGALYFPYLRGTDPVMGTPLSVAPSGFVAGVFAREDSNRGVWKAPAGYETVISGARGVVPTGVMTNARQGELNKRGVNVLRQFPGIGTVVFGARTSVSANAAFEQYKYVSVRRMALFIEQSVVASLPWVIFEPNDTPLWVSVKNSLDNFMIGLFHQGAFQGSTPDSAFKVICDSSTTTPDDQAHGIMNVVIAFCPLKPAEFVIVQIAQLAGQSAA